MTHSYINEDEKCTKLSSSKYSQRRKQENICTTQNFQIECQMKGCSFVGDPETLKHHWKEKKNSTKIFKAVNYCSLKIKKKSYYVNLLEAFGQLFWFKSMINNGLLYCVVQLITNPNEAHKFFHQIEISHRTFPKKKIIVSDYCKSIRMSNFELFQEEICIILYIRNLKLFISDDGEIPKLNYALKVFKVAENPERWKNQFSEKPDNQRSIQSSEVRTLQNDPSDDICDTNSPVVNSAPTELIQGQEHHDSNCCSLCVLQHCIIS
ncbi:hypothetical protein WA026_023137 [Henosepilachna vigintioctopunctata]|uniref:E3 ubiquitin-protein ligase n=1 Tax=Henosepilachna vigintioctopunctata TaxID=420089 RepID=A0AAW1TPX4_9CUCU